MRALRLGCLSYINVLPVVHGLIEEQPDRLEVVYGEPRRLNGLLAEGLLDAAPISSVEYARHQDDYIVLPDLCISSRGPVGSVLLFSWVPLNQLHGHVVGICGATATSSVLLQTLLEDRCSVTPVLQPHASTGELETGELSALLLIGDDALRYRNRTTAYAARLYEYDLGSLWWESTRLPMVFAVWAARRRAAGDDLLNGAWQALTRARERGRSLPQSLLLEASKRTDLNEVALREYYQGLHYTLDEDAQRGLLAFYRLAASKGLCPPCTEIHFLRREASLPQ